MKRKREEEEMAAVDKTNLSKESDLNKKICYKDFINTTTPVTMIF